MSTGALEEVSATPTTELDFKERSGLKTTLGATFSYALFLSPSNLELQRKIEVIIAELSRLFDGSSPSVTTAETIGSNAQWW